MRRWAAISRKLSAGQSVAAAVVPYSIDQAVRANVGHHQPRLDKKCLSHGAANNRCGPQVRRPVV